MTAFYKQYNVVNDDMEQPRVYKGVRIENRVDRRRIHSDDERHFNNVRAQLIENLVTNLHERFPHVEILHAMQVKRISEIFFRQLD